MKLVVRSSADADWDTRAAALGAAFFHSRAWAAYTLADQSHLTPLYVSSEDGAAMALFFLQQSGNPLFRALSARLFSHAHPAVRDPEQFPEFLAAIEDYAREKGIVELELGSFATPGRRDLLERAGYALTDRCEFALPLQRTDEQMRGAMRKGRRNTIQKAIDRGLTVESLSPEEGIPELRRLLACTEQRLNLRGAGVNFGPKRPVDQDPIRLLLASGHACLFGVRWESGLVSVCLYTQSGDSIYTNLAAHSAEAYELNSYTLLIWTLMRRYRDQGLLYLNLGGVPASASEPSSPDHGLYSYKAGLGGECWACASGLKILRPAVHQGARKIRALLGR